ncbi:ribbon-helix-helix domain-containing protein [Egbenema bharatensis]|uniref:ribbon-helix-helix domain-containing protein n=1 Tax=Egbenema bharatensis TaxID=3463334 RepID=UPI003A8C6EDA
MNIVLTPEQEAILQTQLQTGRFQSREEVIQAAFQLLVSTHQPTPPQRPFRITPIAPGSGYTSTAIEHDQVLAENETEPLV